MKDRSTTSQLLEIMDHWTESFDLNTQIDCIDLDFKKAFDSVSLELLIQKLKSYNISDSMITCTCLHSLYLPFQNGVYLAIYTCLFRWCLDISTTD